MHDDPNYLELRYERLVTDPEDEIGRLFDKLGEDAAARERALDHARHFDRRAGAAETSADRVAQPIDTTAIGRWQRDLTDAQLARIDAVAGRVLRTLGYV